MQYTSCTASLGLHDGSAKYDATYSSTNAQSFVDFSRFNLEGGLVPPKIATLEDDYFWLDSTFSFFPDNPTSLRYIYWSSTMSGANRSFSTPPVLKIQFTHNHSSIALTLRFYEPTDDYPDLIEIRWYNQSGALISSKQFEVDSAVYIANNAVENYQRIEISFLRTNRPYRYIKMLEIGYGIEKVFGRDEITSAKLFEQSNPISTELPYNTLSMTVHSTDDEFSPLNPKGMFAYLQEKQPLDVTGIINNTSVYMGTYYLDSWEAAKDNSLTLKAIDLLGVIDQTNFLGGMYSNVLASSIIAEIMTSAGVGTSYHLSAEYKNVRLSGHLGIQTHRSAIQQVAIALGAFVDCSRSNVINILPPPTLASVYIEKGRKFTSDLKLDPVVTGVTVVSHNYIQSNEQKEIINETMAVGQHEIIFGAPMWGLAVTGATILESNVNRALINVQAADVVVLTGKTYIDTQKSHTQTMSVPAGTAQNIKTINAATLISDNNVEKIAIRVLDYFQQRYKSKIRYLFQDEKVGILAVQDSLRDEKLRGVIEALNIDLTGGFMTNAELSGIYIETFDGNYTGEFWTNELIGVI